MAPKPSVTMSTIQTKRLDRSNHSNVEMADGQQDQHAAHGGRAALAQVRLHRVAADGLADLQRGQPPDHKRPGQQADQQRREAAITARKVRYWKTRKNPNSGEIDWSHWARLSSMGLVLLMLL
jgi:hypothetical protein